MGDWVNGLAPWKCFSTLTFRWHSSLPATVKAYEKFMDAKMPGVSYFYAVESNPSGDGTHVHALWTEPGVQRRTAWKEWFDQYGRARIEPIGFRQARHRTGVEVLLPRGYGPFNDQLAEANVTDYCAKYVCKDGAWWNVRLKGAHHPNAKKQRDLVLV